MEFILKEILDFLVDIAGTVFVSLACVGLSYAVSWVKIKIKSDKLKDALSELEIAIVDGIYYVEQTLVKRFKASDEWDEIAQEEALNECYSYVCSSLSDATKQLLSNEDEIKSMIIRKIESKLGMLHADSE